MTPLSTPAAQGTVAEPTSFIWTDELYAACEAMGIPVHFASMDKLIVLWRGITSAAQFAPSSEALPASGVEAVREAARTLYHAFKDARELPPRVFDAAGKGHFFSALRLLFEPDAALTSAPAPEDR